jgi:hypothetical protein
VSDHTHTNVAPSIESQSAKVRRIGFNLELLKRDRAEHFVLNRVESDDVQSITRVNK